MVDLGELENYLNDRSAAKGDIVEITGEGVIEIMKDDKTGKVKKLLNLPVLLNGQLKLIYSPGRKATDILVKEWGRNTRKWVGKKFQIDFVVMQIGKDELNVIKPVP